MYIYFVELTPVIYRESDEFVIFGIVIMSM